MTGAHSQPHLLHALPEHPVEAFAWPDGSFVYEKTSGHGLVQLGLRDQPEHQKQSVEIVPVGDLSLLIEGSSGSGRTSVLKLVVAQLAAEAEAVVILDPLAPVGSSWTDVVRGDGVHEVLRDFGPELGLLLPQLEQVLLSDRQSSRPVVLVIDRLDSLVSAVDALWHERIAYLIADGPRRGVVVVASTDSRTSLPPAIRRSFRHAWSFSDAHPYILEDSAGNLMRPFHLGNVVAVVQVNGSALALGRVSEERGRDLLATLGLPLAIGVDELTHSVLQVSTDKNLCVAYGRAEVRVEILNQLGANIFRTSGRRLWVVAPASVEVADWGIDILGAVEAMEREGTFHDRLLTCTEKDSGGTAEYIICYELESLERERMRRFGQNAELPAVIPGLSVLYHRYTIASSKRAPVNRAYGGAFELELSDHVWLQPPQQGIMNLMSGLAPAVATTLAAYPGKRYGPRHGTASIDGERYEIFVPPALTSAGQSSVATPGEL